MSLPRSRLAALAAVLAVLPALHGCFPLIATGVGAGALMVADRRSSGAYIEDQAIEVKAQSRIGEHFGRNVNASVVSYNRNVLLAGEVPDAATKAKVEEVVSGVPNVRGITNELQIGTTSPYSQRANDAYITSKVKARFVDANRFSANHVKVFTEAGTVYLLGLVTRREADDATEIARTTSDVQRVVRVFEYIDESQAKQLDSRPPEDARATQK